MVTGQLTISLFIIAARFAALKSRHNDDEPVSATVTPRPLRSRSGPVRSSAALTISFVSGPAAPARMSAVRPSRDTDTPGCGGSTSETRGSARSRETARSTARRPAGPETEPWSTCTTTCSAALDIPANSRWTTARAATDSDPDASHPAPARACSTRGANAPSATATTAQARNTARAWSTVQRPRRPSGPATVAAADCRRLVAEVVLRSGNGGGHGSLTGSGTDTGRGIVRRFPGFVKCPRGYPIPSELSTRDGAEGAWEGLAGLGCGGLRSRPRRGPQRRALPGVPGARQPGWRPAAWGGPGGPLAKVTGQ